MDADQRRSGLGVVTYALDIHQRQRWAGRHAGLDPASVLLEECHLLDAGGIQCPLDLKDAAAATALRQRAERYGMFLEASLTTPRDDADVARFEKDVRLAKEAGVSVCRTVVMPGRRYEQFKSMAEFRQAEVQGLKSLQLAEPVVAKHRFRLAVENHKDQRAAEKLDTLKRLGSEWVGVCVDVGNNLALLEDPLEVVRAFAPWAFTVHLKDHVVCEYEEGFLLADMALGEGFLDLPAIIRALREARPEIRFCFEGITRDGLKVPVLTDGYWVTLSDTPARDLARTWGLVKAQASAKPPVAVSKLSPSEQQALERRNVERSLAYARDQLGL
jgi:sugar phosphate isomerase/epimerase